MPREYRIKVNNYLEEFGRVELESAFKEGEGGFMHRFEDNKRSKEWLQMGCFPEKERRIKEGALDDTRPRRPVLFVHVHRGANENALILDVCDCVAGNVSMTIHVI